MTSKRTHAVFLRTSTAPARWIVKILAYPTIARTQQHTILSENSKSKIMIRSASSSLARSAVARQVCCHARRAPSSSSSSALLSLSTSHTTQQSVSTVSHRNFSTTMDIMSLNYGVEPLEDQIIKTFSDHTVSIFADSSSKDLDPLLELFGEESLADDVVVVPLDDGLQQALSNMTPERPHGDYFVFVGNTLYVNREELLERHESGALEQELQLAEMRL